MEQGYKDLKVYQLAYKLAMEIFEITKSFPKDCRYITKEIHDRLYKEYEEVGRMLGSMVNNPERFLPKN